MFIPVTDPAILAKLGGNEPKYKPVNDHKVIARLNAQSDVESGYKLPEFPFVNRAPTKQEKKPAMQNLRDFAKGASQSVANTPEQIAQVAGKHLYKPFDYAPKNEAAKAGEVGGDIASYFLPGGAVKGVLGAAKYLPAAAKAITAAEKGIKSKPIVNFLANMMKNVGEGALFQKAKNPGSEGIDVAKAGGISGALGVAANAATNTNPLINTLARAGLGGGLGYQYGGLPGAAEGAAAATMIPGMMKELGANKGKPISAEILTQEPNEEALHKYLAGKRIGDVPSPAEAFSSSSMGADQGAISRSQAGEQAMTDYGNKRIENQQTKINNLINNIYDKSDHSANHIRELYKKAYTNKLSKNAIHDLFEDPVMGQAAKKIIDDPAYMKDLKDEPVNSFAYLDQVKRSLDDMKGMAERAGENNKARIYGDTINKLIKTMDEEAPVYKTARDAAQRKIVRDQIDERLNKKPIKGKTFFNEFLSNENKFKDLMNDVKKVPGAQQDLRDMKKSWDDLIENDKASTGASMSKKHTSTAREGFQKFWTEFKDSVGAPRDVERANFIKDPDWWLKFDEVMKYKNKLEKNKKLADLVSQGLSASTLETAQQKSKPMQIEVNTYKREGKE